MLFDHRTRSFTKNVSSSSLRSDTTNWFSRKWNENRKSRDITNVTFHQAMRCELSRFSLIKLKVESAEIFVVHDFAERIEVSRTNFESFHDISLSISLLSL